MMHLGRATTTRLQLDLSLLSCARTGVARAWVILLQVDPFLSLPSRLTGSAGRTSDSSLKDRSAENAAPSSRACVSLIRRTKPHARF